jgi:hypothetical protein
LVSLYSPIAGFRGDEVRQVSRLFKKIRIKKRGRKGIFRDRLSECGRNRKER